MNIAKLNKKGQALPLNTIVIAILVIIVLLVIIVFFTSKVGESGKQLDEHSISQCNMNNPALATIYDKVEDITSESCTNQKGTKIPGISGTGDNICCGIKTSTN